MNNVASMETSALLDLMTALVAELIRRDKSEPMHLYAVNGAHTDDAPQITGDFVVAVNEEEAVLAVSGVRTLSSDGWSHDLTYLHLEHIRHSVNALRLRTQP